MTPKNGTFFKALITRFHPQNEQALLRFLPAEEQEIFRQLPEKKVDFSSILSPKQWSESIHYSWFIAPLKTLPSSVRPFFIQAFPTLQQKKLQEKLSITPSEETIPHFFQTLLLNSLKKKVIAEDILPIVDLPNSEMNLLLDLKKNQLVHLLDLLGIHDLAADLRQVLDKSFLGKVYSLLTQEQLHFLHYTLKQPLKWTPPKLNLSQWDGDKKTLSLILHQRGLSRLAKALSDEHPSLKWHVCHRLDIGRAAILMKLFSGKQDPAMIPYFKSQVLHLVRRYLK